MLPSGQIGFDLLLGTREIERSGVGIGMVGCVEDNFFELLLFEQVEDLFSLAEAVGFERCV